MLLLIYQSKVGLLQGPELLLSYQFSKQDYFRALCCVMGTSCSKRDNCRDLCFWGVTICAKWGYSRGICFCVVEWISKVEFLPWSILVWGE